jgi:hypothetical protein
VIAQKPGHRGASVIGIKIVRLEAGQGMRRIFLRHLHLHFIMTLFQDLEGEIVAGIVVIGFLDHLDAGGFFFGHQLLRHPDGDIARRTHFMQRPAAARANPAKDFVMNLISHAADGAAAVLNGG